MKKITKVAVIGTGTMGTGIAQVLAQNGLQVRIFDIDSKQLAKSRDTLRDNLILLVQHGIVDSREVNSILNRIIGTSTLSDVVQGVDLVLEVVPEVLEIKSKLFAELDSLLPEEVLLASNTSGLSITAISESTGRPGLVIGMHWWNPPTIIPVIEVIKGRETEESTVANIDELIRRIKKIPVLVKKDVPGFLGNRLQYALMREAIALLNEGVASAEDIDTMIKAGIGFKFPVMGPLETIDMAGIDIFRKVSTYLYGELNSDTTPPQIVTEMVNKNHLGLKTGQGFYDYSGINMKDLTKRRISKLLILLKELGYRS
jgi:3-hydroxybutyryl-CoA dehydrogenase